MKALITKLLTSTPSFAPLALRIPIGIILMAHGSQKLFGWFGGGGLAGTAQWMESIGLAPGYLMALLSGSAEFFGGLALVVGLLARPAALALTVTLVLRATGLRVLAAAVLRDRRRLISSESIQ